MTRKGILQLGFLVLFGLALILVIVLFKWLVSKAWIIAGLVLLFFIVKAIATILSGVGSGRRKD